MKTSAFPLPDLNQMTLSEKTAQMIMIDFPGHKLSKDVESHLRSRLWGGFILFSKNVDNRPQLTELNRRLSELCGHRIPPYISVDQEGGLVNRMVFDGMHIAPSQMALGYANDENLTEETAFISGVELRELGFHLNYAPVADVNCNPENPIIGARSYGDNPEIVSSLAAASVRGYIRAGIGCCAKHFPGHGDTVVDSHLGLPMVDASLKRLQSVELPPFEKVISGGVPSLMTAHVHYKAFDPSSDLPATLSPSVLRELLRNKMGFEGLVITDSMLMKAISDRYGPSSAVLAVNAGADIVMMCGTPESQLEAHGLITEAVEKGEIPIELIDRAVKRILSFKEQFVINPMPIPHIPQSQRIKIYRDAHRAGVKVIYDKEKLIPLQVENKKVLVATPSRIYRHGLFEQSGSQSLYHHLKNKNCRELALTVYNAENPHVKEITGTLPQADIVIIEIYHMGRPDPLVKAMVDEITENKLFGDAKVFLCAMACPIGLNPNVHGAFTAFNCSGPSLEALAEKVFA